MKNAKRNHRIGGTGLLLILGLAALGGCLGKPKVDERWTLLELMSARPGEGAILSPGQSVDVEVSARITYRDILTGFVVAEARFADSLSVADVNLDPTRHTIGVAQDVDRILANSVTAGRATRGVTGFDHLMQDVDLEFTATVPAEMVPGSTAGIFLVLYMGEGDEIELQGGEDSLVVTPFDSGEYQILHTGIEFNVQAPVPTVHTEATEAP